MKEKTNGKSRVISFLIKLATLMVFVGYMIIKYWSFSKWVVVPGIILGLTIQTVKYLYNKENHHLPRCLILGLLSPVILPIQIAFAIPIIIGGSLMSGEIKGGFKILNEMHRSLR